MEIKTHKLKVKQDPLKSLQSNPGHSFLEFSVKYFKFHDSYVRISNPRTFAWQTHDPRWEAFYSVTAHIFNEFEAGGGPDVRARQDKKGVVEDDSQLFGGYVDNTADFKSGDALYESPYAKGDIEGVSREEESDMYNRDKQT